MMNRLRKRLASRDGFTLMEVLVVVALLGVLAAILTPKFREIIGDTKFDAAEAKAKEVQVALERYALSHSGEYPDKDSAKDALKNHISDKGLTFYYVEDDDDKDGKPTYEVYISVNGVTDRYVKVTPDSIETSATKAGDELTLESDE